MKKYNIHQFPKTRIATFDVCSIGKKKHHISVLLECDVTESRLKIKNYKKRNHKISFTAWILKAISESIKHHEKVAGYLYKKQKIITFDDINISIVVEKDLDGNKVPIPLVIEKTNEKDILTITKEIEDAKNASFSNKDIVLNQRSNIFERFYYILPGLLRRMIWKFMLNHPKIAYKKMGNVVVSSIGMMGQINGWFIQTAVHPISFGIGSIIKKPIVDHDTIKIREILNMTVLIDHDVIDGAPMTKFIQELTNNIETGIGL